MFANNWMEQGIFGLQVTSLGAAGPPETRIPPEQSRDVSVIPSFKPVRPQGPSGDLQIAYIFSKKIDSKSFLWER